MKTFLIILITLFLTSCVTSQPQWSLQKYPINPDSELLDFPELDTTTERNLGDTLVVKGIQTRGIAFKVINEVKYGDSSYIKYTANQEQFVSYRGVYTHKKNGTMLSVECAQGFRYAYHSAPFSVYKGNEVASLSDNNVTICLSDTGQFIQASSMTENIFPTKIFPADSIEKTTKTVRSEASFKQELIYNGRLGDGLKFIYREFSGDMARPAFTQDIQYDLNTSNIIGFKNVKLEVISATNTLIKYKVISNF